MEHPLFDREALDVEPDELAAALAIQMQNAALEGEWNDYSHLVVQHAHALQLAERAEDALREYLWALYVDLNGPSNVADMPEALRQEFPAFDAGLGFIANDVVEQVQQLSQTLKWEALSLETTLTQVIEARRVDGMALTPEAAWQRLAGYFTASGASVAVSGAPLSSDDAETFEALEDMQSPSSDSRGRGKFR